MINVLVSICKNSNLDPLWSIIGFIVDAIMIGVPILLIIFGMIDLGKAVIASKEDEVKKATKLLGKRFLYAIGVFSVVWIVTFVLGTFAELGKDKIEYDKDKPAWTVCWKKIRS